LNSDAITDVNQAFATHRVPTAILNPRLAKFSVNFEFWSRRHRVCSGGFSNPPLQRPIRSRRVPKTCLPQPAKTYRAAKTARPARLTSVLARR